MSYWIKRPLYRLNRRSRRLLPSIHVCPKCKHHVQPNHDHPFFTFGRRFPDKNVKLRIARVRPIGHFIDMTVKLPANFSLRDVDGVDYTPPIDDQGSEGSCTGEGVRDVKGSQERASGTWDEDFSVRFAYNSAKEWGGYLDGEGAYMLHVYEALIARGACRQHYWEYVAGVDSAVWPPPNPDALVDAMNYQIEEYADLMKDPDGSPAKDPILNFMQTIYQLRTEINPGTPWTKSWMDAWYVGKMPVPTDNDPLEGGHSWGIYGWRTEADGSITLLCQNSWGETNLLKGYFEVIDARATFTCKNWQNAGGAECYKAIDKPSHVCPKGQHWDGTQCVDDGGGPEPVNCEEQDIECTLNAMKEPDFFTMLYKAIMCFFGYFECKFTIARLRKMINKTLGNKTSKTKRMTFAKVGIELSLTVKKLKDEGW